jgi:hypothetical protein
MNKTNKKPHIVRVRKFEGTWWVDAASLERVIQLVGEARQEGDLLRALATAIQRTTWDEAVTGHIVIGPHSWKRIQSALTKWEQSQSSGVVNK